MKTPTLVWSLGTHWKGGTSTSGRRPRVCSAARTTPLISWAHRATRADTITSATHAVDELVCNTSYEFRVSAYADGDTYKDE